MELRTWKRDGYTVWEVPFDYALHHFDVVTDDGEHVGTICPADIDDMKSIIVQLDSGEGVDGWEDGMGNIIYIPA